MTAAAVFMTIIALAYATVTDLRARRIPNKLTFPMLAGGLLLHAVTEGQSGILTSVSGAGLALALTLAPFLLNWVGAGDVKLAMVVGALMGPGFVFPAIVFAAVVAGAIAVFDISRKRQLILTAQYLAYSWHLPAPKSLALKGRLPYAPALACGSLITLALITLGL